jgi:hypothetical protein
MRSCSVCKKLRIVRGCLDDYKQLAHYHYRDSRLGPFAAIFNLKPAPELAETLQTKTVGVIVYTMPSPSLELRNIATNNFFVGFQKSTQLALINKNIRCISRVIIDPRFRGLGLASRLVRQTMPEMNVPVIEAMAVMGLVNPFFEKAGMKAYTAKMSARFNQLIEALSMVGIEEGSHAPACAGGSGADHQLIDAEKVQRKLERLPSPEAEFIEFEIRRFLQGYGKHRNSQPGLERTRYMLSKLTLRPVYYIWFNPRYSILDTRYSYADRESGIENQERRFEDARSEIQESGIEDRD